MISAAQEKKRSERSSTAKEQAFATYTKIVPTQATPGSWLVFQGKRWYPLDRSNQLALDHTIAIGGTFVDIQDSHFPKAPRVRVVPKENYLSYLGVKYQLSRVVQPDAWKTSRSAETLLSSASQSRTSDDSSMGDNALS